MTGFEALAASIHAFATAEGLSRRDPDAVTDEPGSGGGGLARSVAFQRRLFDAGLAWFDGPVEHGGHGLDPATATALRDVLHEYVLPDQTYFTVSRRIVAPTILAHGTPQQQTRWIRALWRADVLACQLFSEPEAGSDLAALRCTAVRDGDAWVVNGQKVWSSWAHLSDVGELLARTGAPADRHRSITAFLVEMNLPGITVRPIRQINGGSHFNEVFFDDVRIPDSARLGAVNDGWTVAMSTLTSERTAMGSRDKTYLSHPYRRLRALTAGDVGDADQRLLAEAWMRERLGGVTADRVATAGLSPSVGKLALVDDLLFYGRTAAHLLGPDLVAGAGTPGAFWSDFLLSSPAQRIAGGTDQIQRGIVAERVLGLPRDWRT
ncbi:acyl-CoA dehydrogenase family protein [Dactylosporangium sp. NBC_01737]|uniref:acyl-CoA dehydrogenase family protein n=1 Tax=Dactylosporangium sp. NBC_01737 TaxID=2975959 RepID=UPI002E127581|nr:acyl-CoA dehydrogenase family protein [Dactylosporangium sp. NBC_01737]